MIDMATFEIKMIFKKSSDMDKITSEINMISKKSNVKMLEKGTNLFTLGTDDINCFGRAYIFLSYSEMIKSNLLDAIWKDKNGTISCRKGLLAPVA